VNHQDADPPSLPSAENGFLAGHIELLSRSLFTLTGRLLTEPGLTPAAAASHIFHAPFVVLSHNTEPDPILNYANLSGLKLFELDWDTLIHTPSRLTAEAPLREERQRLLQQVSIRGYIDDYSGIRVSHNGRRFRIEQATVWNLQDEDGKHKGQAAMFSHWEFM
jgi:hypothetical protein